MLRPDAKMQDFSKLQDFLNTKRKIWPDISLDYMDTEHDGNNPNHIHITATLHE